MTSYQRFLKNNSTLKSAVLGEYNNEDKYVIPQDIVEELIKCNKTLVTYREEEARCEAYINDQKYEFVMKFLNDKAENKRYASFYVLESFKHLGKQVDLTTFLISFAEENNAEYLDKLKSAFHLSTKDESEGKDIKNTNEVIGKLIQQKKYKAKQLNKELMMSNRKYIQDVLMVLKKSGPYGAKVQKMLKDKLANITVDKNDPDYWAKVKEILDELLEETKEDCPEEVKKWLELVNQNYIQFYLYKASMVKPFENRKTLVPSGVKHKSQSKKKKGIEAPDPKKEKVKKKSSKQEEKEDDKLLNVEIEKFDENKETKENEDSFFISNKAYRYLKANIDLDKATNAIYNATRAAASLNFAKTLGEVNQDPSAKWIEQVGTKSIHSPNILTEEHETTTKPSVAHTIESSQELTF